MANDITFNSGAFSPREDAVFRAATEYALEERLPLLYLAANSGARVGLANEVKQSLQVPCSSPLRFFGSRVQAQWWVTDSCLLPLSIGQGYRLRGG